MILPVADFAPDESEIGAPGAIDILGALPAQYGWRQTGNIIALTSNTSLSATSHGGASMMGANGINYTFGGDAANLYMISYTSVANASKVGGYSASAEFWEFVQWGDTCIATDYVDPIQTNSLNSTAGLFADLITSTETPKARHLAVQGDFLVIGNVNDSDGVKPSRVRWSGINDPTDFDVSATTQSDYQDLRGDGGAIQRIVSLGEFALIFQERAIWRMTYVGPPLVFQFDLVEANRGCGTMGNAVTVSGRRAYYLSHEGFFYTEGVESVSIGAGKIDRWIWEDASGVDHLYLPKMCGAIIPDRQCVIWVYRVTGQTVKHMIGYSWVYKKWFQLANVHSLDWIFNGYVRAYSSEPIKQYMSGFVAAGAGMGGELNYFDPSAAATQEIPFLFSQDFTLYPGGGRAMIRRIRLLSDVTAHCNGSLFVYYKENTRDSWSSVEIPFSAGDNEDFFVRVSGRFFYIGVLLTITATKWDFFRGFDIVEFSPAGIR